MSFQYRLGVDIGGTFTDATLIDETTGETRICKVSSTPADPSQGFLEAVRRILEEAGVSATEVGIAVHGTTVATNAIIEGTLAPTAFLTTDGFRDMLEIARQIRPSLYDVHFQQPTPLVSRDRCYGVPERLDAQGMVLVPLDEQAVARIGRELAEAGIASVAVCLLHSYLNPAHEQRVGEILKSEAPELAVSLSCEVAPEFREYFRASTTVINAGIRPIVAAYLEQIESALRETGLEAQLLLMQSSGGVYSFAVARQTPVYMVESGPAAGVIAAADLGTRLNRPNILSFDMGGTTAKAGLIEDGTPQVTKDYEVGLAAFSSEHGSKAGGYPIRTPVIDLVEIGAGGGSIAWVDEGGVLRVGPTSAGADPGPACYGQGGTEPTITDANLLLGRLDPDYFLGGEITLDVDAARRAIEERCAAAMGMDVLKVAYGIVEISNSAMAGALRRVSIQRGYDPRDFTLVAFGGAGPLHANRLAAELDVPTVLIPNNPGIFSAMGLLVTDLKHDYSATMIRALAGLDLGQLQQEFATLAEQGREVLEQEAVAEADIRFEYSVDVRLIGQSFELNLELGAPADLVEDWEQLPERFHAEHERTYGFAAPGEPIELVNLRLTAVGTITKPQLKPLETAPGQDASETRPVFRPVYFAETDGPVDCPVLVRYSLLPGDVVSGPAVIQEMDSTTLVHPGYAAGVDEYGNLLIQPA